MNENEKRKREWVKTAAIVFLAVMLVLTFFSNTIMNYSLPEVATQYVQPGTITARIRGTGQVESGDPYEIKVTESRKVASVAVRVGDVVQKGDVILYLADSESTELEEARKELEAAQDALQAARDAYNQALLTEGYTAADIQAATGNTSVSAYRQQLTDAQNAVVPLQTAVNELDQAIKDIDAQIELETGLRDAAQDRVNTASATMAAALGSVSGGDRGVLETAVTNAQAKVNAAQTALDGDGTGDPDGTLQKSLDDAKAELTAAQNRLTSYNNALSTYNTQTAEVNTRNQNITNLNSQRALKSVDLYNATKSLTEAQNKLNDLTEMLGNMVALDSYLDAISDAQKVVNEAQQKVEDEVAKSQGATVTADIAGTVTAINVTAGNTTTAAEAVAVLQPEGAGYTLSFSVTNDQARRVAVGDRAELVNAWRYDDVQVTLASIKPDTTDPGQKKLLTFNVEGSVVAGQTFNVSVGQQSANFDFIVPNSAIREDNNGKFILIVESRSTPLGNRYRATRVDVEVLASDDNQSALSSAMLSGYEFVITTSTQPVEAGQLVRLADN